MCVQKAGFWNYEMSWRSRVKAVRMDDMDLSHRKRTQAACACDVRDDM